MYHKNGKIGAIQNFKDGVLHGELIEYYENGNIKIKDHLKDKFSPRVLNRVKINGNNKLAGLVRIEKVDEKNVGTN